MNRHRVIHTEDAHLILWVMAQYEYYYEEIEMDIDIDTNPDERVYP